MKSLLPSTWFALPFMENGIILSSLNLNDHLIFGRLLSVIGIDTEDNASSIAFDNRHLYLIDKITEVGASPAVRSDIILERIHMIRSSRKYTTTGTLNSHGPVVTVAIIAQGVIKCERSIGRIGIL